MSDDEERCNHWLIGAKVNLPLYDHQCARKKGHSDDHVNGMETWNDAAGEWR